MDKEENPGFLYAQILSELLAWFKQAEVNGIIIGGIAVSLIGRPRLTQDIDALVLLDNKKWDNFLQVGSPFGFIPRIKDALKFAQKNRVLLMRHDPSQIDIDISFGALPFEEEALKRSIKIKVGQLSIPLPTPEDLIIMKAVAHRAKDLADIESVLEANKKLDLKRIRRWVKEFSRVLELPEIYKDLEKYLKKIK